MDSNEKKDRGIAIVGTILFHALAVLVLFLMAFKTPLPLPGEEGVEVDLGMMDQGMGNLQPETPAIPMTTQPQEQQNKSEEDIVTQDNEEAPALEQPKNTKPKQEKPVEQPKPKIDPRGLYKSSNNSQTGNSEGKTDKPGDQGNPTGDKGSSTGPGGSGGGAEAKLGDRKTRFKPTPPSIYTDQEIIKVDIKVNRKGIVVSQEIADGYKTTSKDNQEIALKLASQTTFEPDEKAPELQKGSITYTFKY